MNQTSEIEADLSQSQFERDGYLVLEGHFAPHQIDRAASAMRRLLDERPGEVVAESLRTGRRTFWAQADGRECLHFKVNDLHLMSGEVREVAVDPGWAWGRGCRRLRLSDRRVVRGPVAELAVGAGLGSAREGERGAPGLLFRSE